MGTSAYNITKASFNVRALRGTDELLRDHISVNAICSGCVATDMGGGGGRPVEDGARGVVWAATLPDNGPTGGFLEIRNLFRGKFSDRCYISIVEHRFGQRTRFLLFLSTDLTS
ncbi:MAG: hypothetical protein AAF702_10855 [Chloroflexota bacterium]